MRIESLLKKYTGENVPGVSLMIIQNGTIVKQYCRGVVSMESNVAITSATNFRLASVTKQFTAMCILLLVEQGRLRLDERIDHFFPNLPIGWKKITIRHLLNHTSGLYDYEKLLGGIKDQLTDKDVLSLVKNQKEYFIPGARFRYNNTGYCLLSLIVEKASGISFGKFLHKNIFAPLSMKATVLYKGNERRILHRAYGYKLFAGEFISNDQGITTATSGDGGIYSSLDDMFKRDQALANHTLVSEKLQKKMFSPLKLTSGKHEQYGFGQEITKYSNKKAFYHGGESSGFRNFFYRIPSLGISVVFLSNRNMGGGEKLAQKIVDYYLQAS